MKSRLRSAFLVPLAVGVGAAFSHGGLGASAEGSNRTFELIYQVRLHSIPPAAQELKVWIPLAASDRFQMIHRREIQVSYPYRITQDPEYGNDILFLALGHPLPKDLDLSIEYEAWVYGQKILESPARGLDRRRAVPNPSLEDFQLHLKSNRLMVVDDRIRQLAAGVTRQAKTPLEEAQAIYRYVIERMTYEKSTPGWGRGDTLRACEVGTGNCTDFHALFISLARARGIPARFRIGTPVPEQPEGEIPGYHCWAEFYLDGAGWVPVDASEAWKDRKRLEYFFGSYDPNRLAVSTGRDIRLVPQPANGPVNIFFLPVVEVDGKSFDGIETKFRFKDIEEEKHDA